MRELNGIRDFKFYLITVGFINMLMILGLVDDFMTYGYVHVEFYIQLLLVIVLSISLWIYPKKETNHIKTTITIETMVYLYFLFIFFPKISSSFTLICLIPAISILFFLPRLFYFSLIVNILFVTFVFGYISLYDKDSYYTYLYTDIPGNFINFLASQAVIYFIFYLSNIRFKNQKIYYEKSQQAERLKTTGQIAAAVAHEIRNPITVVKGFLQFYQENPLINRKEKEHFTMMLNELQVAETVISDFLSIAKPMDKIESHLLNVKEELFNVIDLIESFARLNNITVKIETIENLYITCNIVEFKQLFINLLKNAIEASPFGSTLIVSAKEKNRYVSINVIDFGNGMTEQELKLIGTPFYSLKSKGTGLGLMVCFNIVHKYNGSIEFESEKGKGTKVTVHFPSKKEELSSIN